MSGLSCSRRGPLGSRSGGEVISWCTLEAQHSRSIKALDPGSGMGKYKDMDPR